MKTMSIGDHQVNELRSGDVEIVMMKRKSANYATLKEGVPYPIEDYRFVIPSRYRSQLAALLIPSEVTSDERLDLQEAIRSTSIYEKKKEP